MDPNLPTKRLSNVRKRRSSILKSQRPPRTPFSELEFNVATPGDTTSRRVSFSRRKDVAEFIEHEATTTWRSIYVEHNKSDSLGNDSDIQQKSSSVMVRQDVRSLPSNKQQFEEIEADCIEALGLKSRTPFNNFDLTDRLTLEQSGVDSKINAPNRNFEISFLSDMHSDKLDTEIIPETTCGINIDFSAIQSVGLTRDDLDVITDDIRQSGDLAGPFRNCNVSQYIEVDLDMTRRPNEQSYMSITDTITSSKVQMVAPVFEERKIPPKDWMTDKENMVINPYVELNEEDNFAVNYEPEKVLVFTGKNLKYANIDADLDELEEPVVKPSNRGSMVNLLDLDAPYTDLPSTSKEYYDRGPSTSRNISIGENNGQTKSNSILNESKQVVRDIVENVSFLGQRNELLGNGILKFPLLNMDDDLPNFVSETRVGLSKSFICDTSSKVDIKEAGRSSQHDNKFPHLSLTKTVVSIDKRKTIACASSASETDISMTRALSNAEIQEFRRQTTHFEDANLSMTQALSTNIGQEKRRTLIFEDDMGDLSMTQALPSKIVAEEKRRTIVYDDDKADLSMTQALPANINTGQGKRRTMIFEDDMADLSMTQALPTKIVAEEKRRTIVYDDDQGDLSMTQALPANINIDHEKRRTMIFEDDMGDLSMTQALPTKIVAEQKRRTIVYDDDKGDLSMTQALPANINIGHEKRRTMIFEDDMVDLSMTQALPCKIVAEEKRRTIVYDDDKADLSITQALPTNINFDQEKRRTMTFDEGKVDLSMTKILPTRIDAVLRKRKTNENMDEHDVFDDFKGDFSKTRTLPAEISVNETISTEIEICKEKRKTMNIGDFSQAENKDETSMKQEKRKTQRFNSEIVKLSTHSLPTTSQALLLSSNNIISQSQGHLLTQIDVDTKNNGQTNIELKTSKEERSTREVNETENETNQFHKSQEEIVVYQSITTPSNKTITQSIRKVNEANTSIINRLGGDLKEIEAEKFTNFVPTSSQVFEKKISYKETSVDTRMDNPIQVIFSVKKDEDIMSSSEQDVSVCVAHVQKKDSLNFNSDVTRSTEKSVQINDESAFLIDEEDSMVEKSVQINTNSRKSMINEILNMSDAAMDIDFQGEVTSGTQTVDVKKSSDSIIRIIDDEMRESGIDANQEVELEILNRDANVERITQNVTFEREKTTTKTSTEIKPERKNLTITADNTEYIIDALSDYIDSKYVEKCLNNLDGKTKPLSNRQSFAFDVKPKNSRQSVAITREEILNNITEAQAMLKKTYMEIDTEEETPIPVQTHRSATRVSNDIVKVLKFDDSVEGDKEEDLSPLKKNTHIETKRDVSKNCVIPPYLDEVSDDLKEIMGELVKPMVDVPQETRLDQNSILTKSAKIQANLQASSQIDLITEIIKSPVTKTKPKRKSIVPDNKVLTFDVCNPLNNISIPTLINTEVHKYNPITKDDYVNQIDKNTTLKVDKNEGCVQIFQEAKIEMKNEDKVEGKTEIVTVSTQVSDRGLKEVIDSKKEPNVKEVDVNTIIAMKSNNELLAKGSALKIIDKVKDVNRKHNYSPIKALRKDRTPKPLKKILRKSQSPIKNRQSIREDSGMIDKLITECYASVDIDNIKDLDILKKESTKNVDVGVSFESLNSECRQDTSSSEIKPEVPILKSELYCYNSDKVVDSSFDDSKSEKINLKDDYYVPDVINNLEDALNGLPFMGTKLCSLESNTGDRWTFLLLHSRLKLDVKFVTDKSMNCFVKPDTRIENVSIDVIRKDKYTIARQTALITYASIENYLKSHSMVLAEEIPELIQRVTTICWQARRWGQVMEATRTRLAYKITDDGFISLKVANVSLRSIWEVELQVKTTTLPSASDVRVINCLTQYNVAQGDVDKMICKIPKDWGHVPNTLWKLFKYLKNKNTSDCTVLGL